MAKATDRADIQRAASRHDWESHRTDEFELVLRRGTRAVTVHFDPATGKVSQAFNGQRRIAGTPGRLGRAVVQVLTST